MTDGLIAPRLGGFLVAGHRDATGSSPNDGRHEYPPLRSGVATRWPPAKYEPKRRKQKMEQERIRVCGGPLQSEKNRIHH